MNKDVKKFLNSIERINTRKFIVLINQIEAIKKYKNRKMNISELRNILAEYKYLISPDDIREFYYDIQTELTKKVNSNTLNFEQTYLYMKLLSVYCSNLQQCVRLTPKINSIMFKFNNICDGIYDAAVRRNFKDLDDYIKSITKEVVHVDAMERIIEKKIK